ncbi:MAG: ABC transporter ATP-binding protein, partial [Candidatus Thermofonsia bacterium]
MAAIMRGLEAEAYDRQYDDRQLVSRILHYFRPYLGKLGVMVASVFGISLASAAVPIVVSRGIDVMEANNDQSIIPWLIGIVFVIGVGIWLLNWLRRQLTTEIIADVVLAMRQDAFASAAQQDLAFYDEFSSGRVVSR